MRKRKILIGILIEGAVEPEAYAPTARAIAEAGTLVMTTPMPLNLSLLPKLGTTDE